MLPLVLLLLLLPLPQPSVSAEKPPPCNSNIYCYGDLLHTVQMASIHDDSKTFVDMKMKFSPNETLERFEKFMNRTNRMPDKLQVELFVNDTFDPPGSEFEPWDPVDWVENPAFLDRIDDPLYREWASELNHFWKNLGRKIKDDVREHPEQYSIIYVPNPVIVPGGRFREFYYWDSYWIARGLLYSEMYATVKGMLKNFLEIVNTYGLIPNGGRIYYIMRSHPPLLIPMFKSYYEFTKDIDFLNESISTLEREFDFWMKNRTVTVEKDGVKYTLARYSDDSSGPRPESYSEDAHNARIYKTVKEKNEFYSELKAAAESGWDFSTRWFMLNGTNKGNLTQLKTRQIIPVDLNAFIYWNAKILEDFWRMLGNPTKAEYYRDIAEKWKEAVTAVLWHDEVGAWLDYDMLNDIKRDYFYPSNISPLWTGCYDKNDHTKIGKILKYLEKSQVMSSRGGIPTSLEHSGEQWDYPNAWPPLQYIMIYGLDQTDDEWAQSLALEIADMWVRSNFIAFNCTKYMYEKYDATLIGVGGGGGEYRVQLGFGWTNGIILELLNKYGHQLQVVDKFNAKAEQSTASGVQASGGQVLTAVLVLLGTLAIGSIGLLMYKRWAQTTTSPTAARTQRKRGIFPKLCGGYTELKDLNFD
ncbi:trehalase-like [Schistocerca piceifrons]|uniref:trehalase-like n=1 Tax=Schistocerca piceifrons TaxID=274613 RepID=UPI001F5F49B4|nr:trehalase-like [Schistocerca piceifrons]